MEFIHQIGFSWGLMGVLPIEKNMAGLCMIPGPFHKKNGRLTEMHTQKCDNFSGNKIWRFEPYVLASDPAAIYRSFAQILRWFRGCFLDPKFEAALGKTLTVHIFAGSFFVQSPCGVMIRVRGLYYPS